MRIEILLITNDTYIIKKIETLLKGNMNLKIIDKINSNLEIDYSLDLIILDLDVLKNKYNNFLISLSKGFTNSKIKKLDFIFLTSDENYEYESIAFKLKIKQYIKKNIPSQLLELFINNTLFELVKEKETAKLLQMRSDVIINQIKTSQIDEIFEESLSEIKNATNLISLINTNLRFKVDINKFNPKYFERKLLTIDKKIYQFFSTVDILSLLDNKRLKKNIFLLDIINYVISILEKSNFLKDIDIFIKNDLFKEIIAYEIDIIKILLTIIKICIYSIEYASRDKKLYIEINDYSSFQTLKIFYFGDIIENNANFKSDMYLCNLLFKDSGNTIEYGVKGKETFFLLKLM